MQRMRIRCASRALALICGGLVGISRAEERSAQAFDYLVIDVSAGSSAATYPISYLTEAPPDGWADEYKTTKIVLRLIQAGTFMMGSPVGCWGAKARF